MTTAENWLYDWFMGLRQEFGFDNDLWWESPAIAEVLRLRDSLAHYKA